MVACTELLKLLQKEARKRAHPSFETGTPDILGSLARLAGFSLWRQQPQPFGLLGANQAGWH